MPRRISSEVAMSRLLYDRPSGAGLRLPQARNKIAGRDCSRTRRVRLVHVPRNDNPLAISNKNNKNDGVPASSWEGVNPPGQ